MLKINAATVQDVADLIGSRLTNALDLVLDNDNATVSKTVLLYDVDTGLVVRVLEGNEDVEDYVLARGLADVLITHSDGTDLRGGFVQVQPNTFAQVGSLLPLQAVFSQDLLVAPATLVLAILLSNVDPAAPYGVGNWPANSGNATITIWEFD